MADAGRMIVNKKFRGAYESKRNIAQRWAFFSKWAAAHGIKKMEKVMPELVVEFGQYLQAQLDAGERKSSSAPKSYVSSVNTVLKLATNNNWKSVLPGKDCGIQKRSYIPTENIAMTELEHKRVQSVAGDKIASLVNLQRAFGLRFKESCLLNPKIALQEAVKFGHISLNAGTKGGRHRIVPCRAGGIPALEAAILVQDGRSMIPKDLTYKEFQDHCYVVSGTHGFKFHSERHWYAHERYRDLTDAPPPIEAGWSRKERFDRLSEYLDVSKTAAIEIDQSARMIISIELGHSRLEITDAYLG
jgi:hypothetical protein